MLYEEEYGLISHENEVNLGKDTSSRKTQICLYSDPTHFLFELLQNADDYGATTVAYSLFPDRLEVEHNGEPFTWENVRSITYIGKSTSAADPIKEGHFGLGFKSVFAFTATPRVFSGDKCFEIHHLYRVRGLQCPPNLQPGFTRFVLPFNHDLERPDYIEHLITATEAFERISVRIQQLYMMTLLFTRNVRIIRWQVNLPEGTATGDYQRDDEILLAEDPCSIRKTTLTDGDKESVFLVFARPVSWQHRTYKPVEVAFSLNEEGRIVESNEDLFVLFPTEVDTHLRFILNGPYQTNPARETVFRDLPYNKHLMAETGAVFPAALHYLKAHKMLTVEFLGVLPIDDDNVPDFFSPLQAAILDVMATKPLVPTNTGGFAPAQTLVQGPKAIREVISDALLHHFSAVRSRWAAGVMQNSRAEKFLRSLEIPNWSWLQLDECLSRFLLAAPCWIKEQDDDWMRRFYLLLYHLIHEEGLGSNIKHWAMVRTAAHSHVIGKCAYFPADGNARSIRGFAVVNPCLLNVGTRLQQDKVQSLLEDAGVKTITEKEHIERLLDMYYTVHDKTVNKKQHLQHMRRFVKWYAAENSAHLFHDRQIFWHKEEGSFHASDRFFLDKPFCDTGLAAWFKGKDLKLSLWKGYAEIKDFARFATALTIAHNLEIEAVSTRENPSRDILHPEGFKEKTRWTVIDEDYTVYGLQDALSRPSRDISLLLWKTMSSAHPSCLVARYTRSKLKYPIRTAPSELIHTLRSSSWVPDKAGRFHKPEEITAEDLPLGFHFNNDNGWLTAIGFGEAVRRKSEEHKRRQETARSLGITPEIMGLVDLLRDVPDEQKTSLVQQFTNLVRQRRVDAVEFPEHRSLSEERRAKKVAESVREAPVRSFEFRERSVHVSRPEDDPETWLRELYTNEQGQLVCQLCKNEMPFRKRNGEYYFERVKVSDVVPVERVELYLALCPLCAAMYRELVKKDPTEHSKSLGMVRAATECDIPLTLGASRASLRFVETHLADLKTVLQEIGRE